MEVVLHVAVAIAIELGAAIGFMRGGALSGGGGAGGSLNNCGGNGGNGGSGGDYAPDFFIGNGAESASHHCGAGGGGYGGGAGCSSGVHKGGGGGGGYLNLDAIVPGSGTEVPGGQPSYISSVQAPNVSIHFSWTHP